MDTKATVCRNYNLDNGYDLVYKFTLFCYLRRLHILDARANMRRQLQGWVTDFFQFLSIRSKLVTKQLNGISQATNKSWLGINLAFPVVTNHYYYYYSYYYFTVLALLCSLLLKVVSHFLQAI